MARRHPPVPKAKLRRAASPARPRSLRLGGQPRRGHPRRHRRRVAGALVFYPRGEFFWGTVVITLFVFTDLVDGNMARHSGAPASWGAFLDSTLDRVADAADLRRPRAVVRRASGTTACWPRVALLLPGRRQVVSYTKARAEGIGLTANVGIAERAERLVIGAGPAARRTGTGSVVPDIRAAPIALWLRGRRRPAVTVVAADADGAPQAWREAGAAAGRCTGRTR